MEIKSSQEIFQEVHSGNREDKKWVAVEDLEKILYEKIYDYDKRISLIKDKLNEGIIWKKKRLE